MTKLKVPPAHIRKRIGLFKNVQQVVAYRLILDSDFRNNVLNKDKDYEINEDALIDDEKGYNYKLTEDERNSLNAVLKDVGETLGDMPISELKTKFFDEFNEAIDYFVRDFGPEDARYRE